MCSKERKKTTLSKISDLVYLLGEEGVVSLSTHTLPLPGLGIIKLIISMITISLITLPLPGLGIIQIITISDHHGLAVKEFNNAVVSIKIKIAELAKIIKIKITKVTMIIKMKIITTMLPAAHR